MSASAPIDVLEEAVIEVGRLSRFLRRNSSIQVRSQEECQVIRSTALAWFNNHLKSLQSIDTTAVDENYRMLYKYSSAGTSREKYRVTLRTLRQELVSLQARVLESPPDITIVNATTLAPPNFTSLVADAYMQEILRNRWLEITRCLDSKAPLAATIMMGALLEALFLAQVNQAQDKKPIFNAKTAPKDPKTKKTLPLGHWTLNSYIEVGTELKWISKPAREIGGVLRDYRNYIHPERELSTGVTLTSDDALMFWAIVTQLTQQLIRKAKQNSN